MHVYINHASDCSNMDEEDDEENPTLSSHWVFVFALLEIIKHVFTLHSINIKFNIFVHIQ